MLLARTMTSYDFDPSEKARILDEYKALSAEPVPPNRRNVGCTLMIVLPVVLFVLSRWAPQRATWLVLAIPIPILVAGLYFMLFGARAWWKTLESRGLGAVDALASRFNEMSADERRAATLRALYYHHVSDGPTSFDLYDADKQRERLTIALPYIEAVEQVLVSDGAMYRVFTPAPPDRSTQP